MTAITVATETVVAEVDSMPDEVFVRIHADEGIITPDQARHLAALLTKAADDAPHLSWDDDEDNPGVVDDRATS